MKRKFLDRKVQQAIKQGKRQPKEYTMDLQAQIKGLMDALKASNVPAILVMMLPGPKPGQMVVHSFNTHEDLVIKLELLKMAEEISKQQAKQEFFKKQAGSGIIAASADVLNQLAANPNGNRITQ